MSRPGMTIRYVLVLWLLNIGYTYAACSGINSNHFSLIAESLTSVSVVSSIQQRLIDRGYFQGVADGKVSGALIEAVRKYQKKSRLPVDGKISDVLRIMLIGKGNLLPDSIHSKAAKGRISKSVRELSADSDLNVPDRNGWTPLLYASLHGNSKAVSTLLRAGANPDIASPYGTTPLMAAVIMNRADIVRQLLSQWPDIEMANVEGESAEGMAFVLNRNHMLRMFRRQKERMKQVRLSRIPPFKVRMITWDEQECYRATTAGINVSCHEKPDCRLQTHVLKACHKRGEKYLQQIARIVQQKWGGKPEILNATDDARDKPFNCRKGDVMVFGVKSL